MNTFPARCSLLAIALFLALPALSQQNVGINTSVPDESAVLDITAANKGLLVPRVSLGSLTDATTISNPAPSLLVYNISGSLSPGYYFNSGTASSPQWKRLITHTELDAANTSITSLGSTSWRTTGNSLTTTGAFGTTSNNHIDFTTNNIVRGRMTNLGEFHWGSTNTVITGDLVSVTGNAVFPFALSGYSSFNGSGVYGAITGGTTKYAGVQGEYQSNSAGIYNTAGVRGINSTTVAGTGFRVNTTTGPQVGVVGSIPSPAVGSAPTYSQGVHGSIPNTANIRSAGVFGDDGGYAMGAIGYFASDFNDYSFYAFGNSTLFDFETGGAGGRYSSGSQVTEPAPAANRHIGIGVHAGMMGGWVCGLVYGLHARGERYSMYVDGPAVTNQPLTQLVEQEDGRRVATYAPSSPSADVFLRGRAELRNGQAFVPFPAEFAGLLSNPLEASITVTPAGDSRGVFVEQITKAGFYVRENQGGNSTVTLNWMVMGARRDAQNLVTAPELLDKEFDERMNRLMHNEAETEAPVQYMWWDGKEIRYDQPPARTSNETGVHPGIRPRQPGNADGKK